MDLEDEEGTKAVGGREIGLCDICRTKRIRWFCRADSAYLCHTCDNSVHSANSVACRHERIQLTHHGILSAGFMSSWPTKRTRSNRPKKFSSQNQEEFGPHTDLNVELVLDSESDIFSFNGYDNCLESLYKDDGLLFKNFEGSSPVDGLEGTLSWVFLDRVKLEDTDCENVNVGASEGPFDLNIDISDFTVNMEDEDVKVNEGELNGEERKLCLMLNYEDVLHAWSAKGLPWAHHSALPDETTSQETAGTLYGVVPDLNMGSEGHGDQVDGAPVINYYYNEENKYPHREGREARVIRYREKRRSRLFSKRIRYHVRKLNAEKRPRMKGRFVKSASDGLVN